MAFALQRYDPDEYGVMLPISDGDYVLYTDVVNLLKEGKEIHDAIAEIQSLKSALAMIADS